MQLLLCLVTHSELVTDSDRLCWPSKPTRLSWGRVQTDPIRRTRNRAQTESAEPGPSTHRVEAELHRVQTEFSPPTRLPLVIVTVEQPSTQQRLWVTVPV
jgi:hypothetical protein